MMCFIRLEDPAENQRKGPPWCEGGGGGGPAAASCLGASRELPCADVPTASALGFDPSATRPLLQCGSSLLPSRQKQGKGSAKRAWTTGLGLRDQGSRLEAACPRASHAARSAASRASRPTCRALGGLEAGARRVGSAVYVRMCRALSRPGFRRAAPCSCALRMGVSFTATVGAPVSSVCPRQISLAA